MAGKRGRAMPAERALRSKGPPGTNPGRYTKRGDMPVEVMHNMHHADKIKHPPNLFGKGKKMPSDAV